jgi:hypothetical protein
MKKLNTKNTCHTQSKGNKKHIDLSRNTLPISLNQFFFEPKHFFKPKHLFEQKHLANQPFLPKTQISGGWGGVKTSISPTKDSTALPSKSFCENEKRLQRVRP